MALELSPLIAPAPSRLSNRAVSQSIRGAAEVRDGVELPASEGRELPTLEQRWPARRAVKKTARPVEFDRDCFATDLNGDLDAVA
eukprot:6210610-Pleurochrysis_carterae.AAC.2